MTADKMQSTAFEQRHQDRPPDLSDQCDLSDRRNQSDLPDRHGEAGFTLIELLIVMAILVLLASLVAPRVIGYLGASRTKAAKIQMESFGTTLELYRIDTGRYPTSEQGLGALVVRPQSVSAWNGPYLNGAALPNDPWGRPYYYRYPGQKLVFDIYTLGADGQPGGKDENQDVTN